MSTENIIVGFDLDGTIVWPPTSVVNNLAFPNNPERLALETPIKKFVDETWKREIKFWDFEKDEAQDKKLCPSEDEKEDLRCIVKTLMSESFWSTNPLLGDIKDKYYFKPRYEIDKINIDYEFFIASRNPYKTVVRTVVDEIFAKNEKKPFAVINFVTQEEIGKVPHIKKIMTEIKEDPTLQIIFCDDESKILNQLQARMGILGILFPLPNDAKAINFNFKEMFASGLRILAEKRKLPEDITTDSKSKKPKPEILSESPLSPSLQAPERLQAKSSKSTSAKNLFGSTPSKNPAPLPPLLENEKLPQNPPPNTSPFTS